MSIPFGVLSPPSVSGRRLRALLRSPAMALAAVSCLTLGLGAAVAISSAVATALLPSLPFQDPDRLVTVYRTTPHFDTGPHSAANYLDLARSVQQLQSVAVLSPATMLIAVGSEVSRVTAMRCSGNLFSTLGVEPVAGRFFDAGMDAPERSGVAVLSARFWRDRFGADPAIAGRVIALDGQPFTILGVAPDRFEVPHGPRVLRADVWVPLRLSAAAAADRGSNYLMALGRLAPGATAASASEELRRLFAGLVEQHPELRGESVRALPLRQEAIRTVRAPLLLLFAAVLVVLLIACANVASLLLARGVRRQREVAVRAALGGSRWAIVAPILGESVLLALGGLAGGLALGWIGIKTIGSLAATELPQLAYVSLDARVVIFAFVLALLTALICGTAPALGALTVSPQSVLGSNRGGGAGRAHQRALRGLVIVEVAFALTLFIAAGLVLRGFRQLMASDPGFDARRITTFEIMVPPPAHAGAGAETLTVRRVLDPALERVRHLPGVEAVGALSQVPYENWGWNFNVRYEGQSDGDPTARPMVENRVATPELFAVTGQRLLDGRLLESSDDEAGARVVVVNQALARRDFPDQSAIGKRLYDPGADQKLLTIVGVVSDIKNFGPFAAPQPEIYRPYRQWDDGTRFPVLVRWLPGTARPSLRAVADAVHSIAPGAAVERWRTMPEVIRDSLGAPRLYLRLLAVFAGIALLLALGGIAGVMSYSVAQRTRELGIRAALGSSPGRTRALVAGEGLRLVGAGLVLGLLASLGVTRLLTALLYGASALDAGVWVGASVLFAAVGLAASLAPTLRASRADPMQALRAD
ncbi:MAG: ABC transporter permease [Acidobacteriota bacterium]